MASDVSLKQIIQNLIIDDNSIFFARVLSPLPLEICACNNENFIISESSLIIPERLTKHEELHNGTKVTVDGSLKKDDVIIVMELKSDGLFYITDRSGN